jgi:riboflavin synthase
MFSGIVKGVGTVRERTARGGDFTLTIAAEPAIVGRLEIGASIAINGACLTVTSFAADAFTADISSETAAVTTLGGLEPGSRVNLEPSLRIGEPLDGHLVSGHVDGVGRVATLRPAARSLELGIEIPVVLARYVAQKGSICVDGVSLTVNGVDGSRVRVTVIPHTQAVTVISEYEEGTPVNIEVDMIARYLERLGRPQS